MIMEYMNCAYNRFMLTLHLRLKGGGLTSSTAAAPSAKADCGDDGCSGAPVAAMMPCSGAPVAAMPCIASSNEAAIAA